MSLFDRFLSTNTKSARNEDVVNFCEISYETKPIIKVRDILQTLFSKFDNLCDKYSIQRLETIGDVYICTTAMFGKDTAKSMLHEAKNALSLAKDTIKAARKQYLFQIKSNKNSKYVLEFIEEI
jgi:hypothetical protein